MAVRGFSFVPDFDFSGRGEIAGFFNFRFQKRKIVQYTLSWKSWFVRALAGLPTEGYGHEAPVVLSGPLTQTSRHLESPLSARTRVVGSFTPVVGRSR